MRIDDAHPTRLKGGGLTDDTDGLVAPLPPPGPEPLACEETPAAQVAHRHRLHRRRRPGRTCLGDWPLDMPL